MTLLRILISIPCVALLASCTTGPDTARAIRPGGPSIEEFVGHANGIYLVHIDRARDGDQFIVEEVWRHDPNLGAAPQVGAMLKRTNHRSDESQSPGAYTWRPDGAVVFKFDPALETSGVAGRTSETDAMIYDGDVRMLHMSVRELRQVVRSVAHVPEQPTTLQPVGAEVVDPAVTTLTDRGGTRPRLVRSVPPTYPLDLRRRHISGEAVIDAHVLADGTVGEVKVVRATDVRFGEAAVAAVRQWRYSPAVVDGAPIDTRLQVPIIFTLNER